MAVTSLAEDRRFGGSGRVGGHSRVGQQAPMYSRIPMHYGDLAQSGLTATVEGDTPLDLNLQ